MASVSPSSPRPPAVAIELDPRVAVQLELRPGTPRAALHNVSEHGFLIGTVAGCDLRLPGADLPPVICLISRHANGAAIRKLVPTFPLQVNGQVLANGPLVDGDRIMLGSLEILVHVISPAPAKAVGVTFVPVSPSPPNDLSAREEQLAKLRQELLEIRQQLYERYRKGRDRLAGLQEAVGRAARKVQERKRELDTEALASAVRAEHDAVRRSQLDTRDAELVEAQRLLEEQSRLLDARQQKEAEHEADWDARERHLAQEREILTREQAQYQADLVRLDRLQAALEQRQQQLQDRAREIDQRFEQMQRTSRELEEQARELSSLQDKLRGEARELDQKKAERDQAASQLVQRGAALEGQQAMLASLRTRLERMREELRREQQKLSEQQARLDSVEAETQQRRDEAQRLRDELAAEKRAHEEERRQFEERRSALDAAVAQLREVQDALAGKEEELNERARALDAAAATQSTAAAAWQEKSNQLLELDQRVTADRQALRDRETALVQSEQIREALQEQLRRRSEELAVRQRTLSEQGRQLSEQESALETRRAEIEQEGNKTVEQLAVQRQELENRSADLGRLQREIAQREQGLSAQVERLKEVGRRMGRIRKVHFALRSAWQAEQQEAANATAQTRAELEAARQDALHLVQQLPDLELRAQGAAESLTRAREQLRNHLGELHAYASQSQEDIEALRAQTQMEGEQLRQQQAALHRAREVHRLAVAGFRQQLIEWQGQVAEMKGALAQGETRLERRQAQVDEQARQMDATSTRLAQQAEQLQSHERIVVERRQEMERHLDDMREWYRQKLRELSERRQAESGAPSRAERSGEGEDATLATEAPPPLDILALTDEDAPGDRKLAELLRTLSLIDNETQTALMVEARQQRRSLRQVLLAGGYLTLYQMALIETGNVDGLMLGPLRVIDRLRATPREAVYRVFDPRRGQEALLRHLAEAEMEDAVHPDEFRQRFSQAAAIQHPHVAATLEVLEIGDRPAALQEWLHGLPSNEWPALASVPEVWCRLLCQAALGLQTAHQAGLVHGHLDPSMFVLTANGTLKLRGLGEPLWLATTPLVNPQESDAAGDLSALGQVGSYWAALSARRRGTKSKSLPVELQAILNRLATDSTEMRYADASALLEDLDQAGASLTPSAEAWDRLLRHVREHVAEVSRLQKSA